MNIELIEKAALNMQRVVERQTELEQQTAAMGANLQAAEQKLARMESGGFVPTGPRNVLAESMDDIREAAGLVLSRKSRNGACTIAATLPAITKSVIVSGDESSSDGAQYPTVAYRHQGMFGHGMGGLRLLTALPVLAVDSGTFDFAELDGYANAADEVAESVLKPEAHVPMVKRTAQIATVAHWVRASEQVIADAPALLQQLGLLLGHGVAAKGESLIINGNTSDGNTIVGLNEKATIFTPTAAAAADRIGEACAELEATGFVAGLVIVHPADWHAIRSERSSGDDHYTATGWNMPAPPNVWGVPLVTSAACPRGAAFVLDPSHVLLLARQATTVEVFRDLPTQNLVTLRVEARLGFAVLSPAAVLSLTLADASSS